MTTSAERPVERRRTRGWLPPAAVSAARSSRATWIALAVVLALAFGIRAVAHIQSPRPIAGAGLAAEQGEMARNIIHHGQWFAVNDQAYALVKARQVKEHRLLDPAEFDFSRADRSAQAHPAVDQMPGLAGVEALVWWSTGRETYGSIEWLQVLLDTVMVLLVYWIGRRLTKSSRVGILAALLYAVWPGAIVMATRPILDTWAAFFLIASVAAFVWARDDPTSYRRLVVLGLIAGLGIYFRPFIVFVPPLLALIAMPRVSWRRRVLWLAAPTAVALLVLAPWTIRNAYEFHRFIPTRTGLGQAVFEGFGKATSDTGAARYVRSKGSRAAYGSPGYDTTLLNSALRSIRNNPVGYFRLVGERARFLLPCLLLVVLWRRWRREALLIAAAAVATIVPYVFIGSDTRFYLPAAFAYIILVAMGTEVAIGFVRRTIRDDVVKDRKRAANR